MKYFIRYNLVKFCWEVVQVDELGNETVSSTYLSSAAARAKLGDST